MFIIIGFITTFIIAIAIIISVMGSI
jgi:hypothetical protein